MYSEPSQTSKMERFVKTVKDLQPLSIFTKYSIVDVWLGSEYTPVLQSSTKMQDKRCKHFMKRQAFLALPLPVPTYLWTAISPKR